MVFIMKIIKCYIETLNCIGSSIIPYVKNHCTRGNIGKYFTRHFSMNLANVNIAWPHWTFPYFFCLKFDIKIKFPYSEKKSKAVSWLFQVSIQPFDI